MSPLKNGRTLKPSLPTYVITTDASLTGWGAQMGQQSIHGKWTATEKLNHINYLELKTVLIALQQWKYQLKNQTVLLQLDNTTAVAYLLKEGGTQSRSQRYLAAEILILADHHNISVRPSYLPDQMNTQAGRCSIAVGTTRRKDAGSCDSSEDIYGILVTSGRPICITEKQAVEPVLLHRQARPRFPGDGRTTPRLEISEQATVCISPPPT